MEMRVQAINPNPTVKEQPKQKCYNLWGGCIGCPSALHCKDCQICEGQIKRRYPEWYARLLFYKKPKKQAGKKASAAFLDELAFAMKGGA